jgi:hypothetical protein
MTRRVVSVDRPVFIIGCGRSGTTLLYDLLAAHPAFSWVSNVTQRFPSLPQLAYLSRAARRPGGHGRWVPHPAEGHRLWDRVGSRPASANEGPLDETDAGPAEVERARALVAAHVRFHGRPRFLHKNTRHTRHVRYLDAIFPDARFVHLVREPLATVASLRRVGFWPTVPIWWADMKTPTELEAEGVPGIEVAASFWSHEVLGVFAQRAAIDPARWTEVRYESLIADAPSVLRDILRFADVDPDALPGELAVAVSDRNRRYLDELSDGDIARVAEITAEAAAAAGYAGR